MVEIVCVRFVLREKLITFSQRSPKSFSMRKILSLTHRKISSLTRFSLTDDPTHRRRLAARLPSHPTHLRATAVRCEKVKISKNLINREKLHPFIFMARVTIVKQWKVFSFFYSCSGCAQSAVGVPHDHHRRLMSKNNKKLARSFPHRRRIFHVTFFYCS